MWLQLEVVRGPVGVVWNRFGAGFGPKPTPNRPRPVLGQPQIAATSVAATYIDHRISKPPSETWVKSGNPETGVQGELPLEPRSRTCSMFRNDASGPGVGLPGRILAGLPPATKHGPRP